MSKVTLHKCDKCGRLSNGQGADGWVAVTQRSDHLDIYPLAVSQGQEVEERHCCGLECAVAVIQDKLRWMLESDNTK